MSTHPYEGSDLTAIAARAGLDGGVIIVPETAPTPVVAVAHSGFYEIARRLGVGTEATGWDFDQS